MTSTCDLSDTKEDCFKTCVFQSNEHKQLKSFLNFMCVFNEFDIDIWIACFTIASGI